MLEAPIASELMWPGVPVTAWATMRPRRSNTAFARSPASRTIGLNAARCSARACSLTVEIRLCHRISSSTGSNVCGVRSHERAPAAPVARVATRLPSPATSTSQPGRITTVVSRSSTIAGPANESPAPSAGRWYTGTC